MRVGGEGAILELALLGDKAVGCWLEVFALNSGLGVPTRVFSEEIEEAGRGEAIPETTMLGPEATDGRGLRNPRLNNLEIPPLLCHANPEGEEEEVES